MAYLARQLALLKKSSLSRVIPEGATLQPGDDDESDEDDDEYSSDDQETEPTDDEKAKLLRLPSYVMTRARRAARVSMGGSAPDQLSRGASPAFMAWLLRELQSRDEAADETLTSHDAVHGLGAKFSLELHKKTGFGYSAPKSAACIRSMTEAEGTSLFKFITGEHEAGQELRNNLKREFGKDWRTECFGRATHFVSHAWDSSFYGLIAAIRTLCVVAD